MQVVFESARSVGAPLRQRVEARLRFFLRHLSWLVSRVIVRLSDQGGRHEAADKRCEVELNAVGAGNVVVSSTARDWRESIDDALRRAARLLARRHRNAHRT